PARPSAARRPVPTAPAAAVTVDADLGLFASPAAPRPPPPAERARPPHSATPPSGDCHAQARIPVARDAAARVEWEPGHARIRAGRRYAPARARGAPAPALDDDASVRGAPEGAE